MGLFKLANGKTVGFNRYLYGQLVLYCHNEVGNEEFAMFLQKFWDHHWQCFDVTLLSAQNRVNLVELLQGFREDFDAKEHGFQISSIDDTPKTVLNDLQSLKVH